MALKRINSDAAPAAIGPYVHAVNRGGLLFLSGQLGFDMEGNGEIPETAAEQAAHCLDNLERVLKEAGADRTKIIKTTIFLTDISEFGAVNEVYGAFFGDT